MVIIRSNRALGYSRAVMESFLQRVAENNRGVAEMKSFVPFINGGKTYGYVRPADCEE